jgi:polar amino acid transport system substrate-binding protein
LYKKVYRHPPDITTSPATTGTLVRGLLATLLCLLHVLAAMAHGQTLALNTDEVFPRSTPEGTGFEDLILKEAFRRMDLDIRIIPLPSERALINVNDGIDDGTFARIAGLEEKYPNMVMVPARISTFPFTAFTLRPDIRIRTWEDLEPYNVGIVNGWQYPEKRMPPTRSLRKVRQDDTLFEQLMEGKIDVAIHELLGGVLIAKRLGLTGVVAQTPPLGDTEMFLYLNIRHAGLIPRLTDILREMDADGTRQAIMDGVLRQAGVR